VTRIRSALLAGLDPHTLHDLLRLRVDVFVVEQGCPYPELDGRDVEADTVHWWVEEDGAVVAYLRVLLEPDGTHRVGRVVTAREVRGRGLGETLVRRVLGTLPGTVVIDAQSHLADWYARFGFEPSGAEFVEDGIPHTPMTRSG
jgi:ElaA protein